MTENTDTMKTVSADNSEMRGVCVVEAAGAPHTTPLKVKVAVQKSGWLWRCVPCASYKQVAAFTFHWEETFTTRQTYTSLPAALDVGRLLTARQRSEEAVVKIVMKHNRGKVVTLTTVVEFLRRLGRGDNEDFVFGISIESENKKECEEQQAHETLKQDSHESNEGKGMADSKAPWVGRTCKCPNCVLPFWGLLQAWEPLPVKPPTVMDTYVDILSTECTLMKKETDVLLKEKKSCASELAALKAEMARMENEMDRMEASWVNDVMDEGEGAMSLNNERTEEEGCGSKSEEEWKEMPHSYSEEKYWSLDEGEDCNNKEFEKEGSDEAEAAEVEDEEHSDDWTRHEGNPTMLRALSLLRRHNGTH